MSDKKVLTTKDLTPEQKDLLKKTFTKLAAQELQFFHSKGLTNDQIKEATMAYKQYAADNFLEPMENIYKTPLARKVFVLGYCAKKGNNSGA